MLGISHLKRHLLMGFSLVWLSLVVCLTGCTSGLVSKSDPGKNDGTGMVYYLPKRDFVVTVVRANGQYKEIKLATTAAYPDLEKTRLLNYTRGVFSTNRLDIVVMNGLLSSAKSKATVEKDAFASIGAGLGSLAGAKTAGFNKAEDKSQPKPCTADGAHVFLITAETKLKEHKFCGNDVTVLFERLWRDGAPVINGPTKGEHAGVFYRVNLPYALIATGPGVNAFEVLLSPSQSSEMLLPISGTLFTSNDASIGLTNGVPDSWVQETESEVVGLLSLPAKVLAAYASAIGEVFTKFSTNANTEASALAAETKLELAKIKFLTCQKAIADKDGPMIESLKCG